MAYNRRDDDLAYGDYHGQGRPQQEGEEGERGFIGDMGKRFFGGGSVSPPSLRSRALEYWSRRACSTC
jgi:hypothetical protein